MYCKMKMTFYMLAYVYIAFAVIHGDIVLRTPLTGKTHFHYSLLKQYSYAPKTTTSLKFAIKVCDIAVIGLMTSENTADNIYEIVIHESKGIDVRSKHRGDDAVVAVHSEKNLVACDEYRYFIITWNEKITMQAYTNSAWRTLIKMDPLPNYFVNYIGVRSHANADWIVVDAGGSLWSTASFMLHKNVKTGKLWTRILQHILKCAMECRQDFLCLSFTYNYISKQCQGLNDNYNTEQVLNTVLVSEAGSTYYYQEFTPSN